MTSLRAFPNNFFTAMKTKFNMSIPSKARFLHLGIALLCVDSAMAADIVGDTVQGNLTVNGNTTATGLGLFQQGVDFGNSGESSLTWWPGTSPAGTVTLDISWEDGTFTWRDAVTPTAASNKMSLDAANAVTLFKSNGSAGITISPETGRITLPAGNGSSTGSGIYFGNSTIAAITASSTGTPIFSGSAAFAGGIAITSNTPSTSSTTGALTVAGGLGAATDSYINGVRIGRGAGNILSNTALGSSALNAVNTGTGNSAFGSEALAYNTSGSGNLAVGNRALWKNTTGWNNSAAGGGALSENTTGALNAASGACALWANRTGNYNTAVGAFSLGSSTTASENSGVGYHALRFNTTGSKNAALGCLSLRENLTGSRNVAMGEAAGRFSANGSILTDPENSIYIGSNSRAKDNGDYNSIVIGTDATGLGANTTVIGNTSTARTHLHGQTTTPSLEVTGNTSLKGQVIISVPQGDISMGQYQ